jgi:hypothetical protein
MKKNPIAVALGKLAKGKPKTLTEEERQARRQRMAEARAKRWEGRPRKTIPTMKLSTLVTIAREIEKERGITARFTTNEMWAQLKAVCEGCHTKAEARKRIEERIYNL